MDRRTFNKLAGLAAMSALTAELELSTAQAADIAGEVILQDHDFLVAFDPVTGALTRMEHEPTKWTVERRPALGASFRMLVPIPGRRANFVLGQKQKAASVVKISDSQVRIVWKDLASEHGGVLPITLTATVTLTNGSTRICSDLNASTMEDSSWPGKIPAAAIPFLSSGRWMVPSVSTRTVRVNSGAS